MVALPLLVTLPPSVAVVPATLALVGVVIVGAAILLYPITSMTCVSTVL